MANTKSKKGLKLPTVKELLEAGVHFGHETKRWHPNFEHYIYSKRGDFHIIDLEKTLEKFQEALEFIEKKADSDILIVGTKRQARRIVREGAIRAGIHFVTNRWVGGLFTNFDEISKGIKRLRKLEDILGGDLEDLSQQQLSVLRKEWGRLIRLFGGVKYLDSIPDVIIIFDPNFEKIVFREAKKAKIPIVAIVDSNTDPKGVDYPIPANDDAIKSIELFAKYIADAIINSRKGKGLEHKFEDFSLVGIKEEDLKPKVRKKKAKKTTKKRVKKDKKKGNKDKKTSKKKKEKKTKKKK